MTGFATRSGSAEGEGAGLAWIWDVRSVNGRGLDIRMRLSDAIDGLEGPVRSAVQGTASRGNITVTLRTMRPDEDAGPSDASIDLAAAVVARVARRAAAAGVDLRPVSATELLSLRTPSEMAEPQTDALRISALSDLHATLQDFDAVRQAEGAVLHRIIAANVDEIESLTSAARDGLPARHAAQSDVMRDALDRIGASAGTDPARIAQELALLAVKSDVTEELDRLDAHVAAARDLLDQPGPKGRRLDFLTQEFNREANTVCSKAGSVDLTRIGLAMKHAIDQMREQVQNVE